LSNLDALLRDVGVWELTVWACGLDRIVVALAAPARGLK